MCGGYCYVNNVAAAARTIQHEKPGSRIAILDIDYHHGNGTQSIFYNDPSVLYVSLHAKGDYPYFTGSVDEIGSGDGAGTTFNVPLPMNATGDEDYLIALDEGLAKIRSFATDFILVRSVNGISVVLPADLAFYLSLGVDTYQDDPICTFGLTTPVYTRIGARIAQLGSPTLFVFEGYAKVLPP